MFLMNYLQHDYRKILFRFSCYEGKFSFNFKNCNHIQIKNRILRDLKNENINDDNLFVSFFNKCIERKIAPKTKQVYSFTLKRLGDFDKQLSTKRFEDITKGYIIDFENYLSLTSKSKNGRNVHLRNIRAVFNDAIDEGITNFYPFRNFNIRPVQTRKRSLTIEELRTFMKYPVEEYQQRYVDFTVFIHLLCFL